ncbi:MAG: cohesin domain-containing protein [Pyrinomonadaceae bacterium]
MAANNIIQNNFIGYTFGGSQTVPNNGSGIVIRGPNNTVGGTTPEQRNIIAGNLVSGISIGSSFSTGNTVQGNYIGVAPNGTSAFGNRVAGIQIANFAANNTIGGTGGTLGQCDGPCNIIANNGDATVQSAKAGLYLDPSSGVGNAIRGNSIFNNGAASGLGIDLGTPGANANDATDADVGPNNLQNSPVVTDANTFGVINGTLTSTASTLFSIDLYRNDSADGAASEARTFIGSTSTTTNGSGSGTFTYVSPVVLTAGQFITATATRGVAPFDTSEISAAVAVTQGTGPSPTNTVTSTATNTATPTPPASISGTVTYGNALSGPTPPRFVSNVTITGAGSPNVTTTTGAPGPNAGQYTLNGFGSGSYTVTPSKTTGQNGISSFDAARVAQHVAGAPNPQLSGNQLIVADTSNNGSITSFDAGLIARYVVANPPFGIAGNWIFVPASRNYTSVNGDISSQDYSALLMGEVSGDWNNTGARPAPAGPVSNAFVSLPTLTTSTNGEVIVPVSIRGAADKQIIAYEFDLRYDPSVLQPQADPVDLAGSSSRHLTAVVNAETPGLLRVAVYGPLPITKDGILLNLRFVLIGPPGTSSNLTWERIMFNEGNPRASTSDGLIRLASNPAAID